MLSDFWRILIAVIIAAHGIGHILFLLPLLGLANWGGQSTSSWLMGSGVLARLLGSLLWVLALVGFVAVAVGFAMQTPWWRAAALGSTIISLVGVVLFAQRGLTSPALNALIFDVVFFLLLLLPIPV